MGGFVENDEFANERIGMMQNQISKNMGHKMADTIREQ